MGFDVTGTFNGAQYRVGVEDGLLDAVKVGASDPTLLDGSPEVISLLLTRVGDEVMASPTGPVYELDLGKPDTILAALKYLTRVENVDGAAPTLYPEVGPDNVSY